MRIAFLEPEPLYEIPYQNAASGGGTETALLPVIRGRVDRLPEGIDALVITSDLQGIAPVHARNGACGLLGEAVCEELLYLSDEGELPHPSRIGVLLAGDLYSAPMANKRGASGDVRDVWRAFGQAFRWTTGVMGNHDTLGPQDASVEVFCSRAEVTILDGQVIELGGVKIGGVGGIIGESGKPQRKPEKVFQAMVRKVVAEGAEVVMLHQGPNVPGSHLRGSEQVREALEHPVDRLVICGHAHWNIALVPVAGVGQVLNVDGRVVVLSLAPVAPSAGALATMGSSFA